MFRLTAVELSSGAAFVALVSAWYSRRTFKRAGARIKLSYELISRNQWATPYFYLPLKISNHGLAEIGLNSIGLIRYGRYWPASSSDLEPTISGGERIKGQQDQTYLVNIGRLERYSLINTHIHYKLHLVPVNANGKDLLLKRWTGLRVKAKALLRRAPGIWIGVKFGGGKTLKIRLKGDALADMGRFVLNQRDDDVPKEQLIKPPKDRREPGESIR